MCNVVKAIKDYIKTVKYKEFKKLNYIKYKDDNSFNKIMKRYEKDFDVNAEYKIQRMTKEGWYTYHVFQSKGYLHQLIYIVEYFLFVNPREKVRIIDYKTGRVVYE
jgi:hypothetical protein